MKVVKAREYVWKLGRFRRSAAYHGWMNYWKVVDAHGNLLAGWVNPGNNVNKARAEFNRKMDAQAWLDGYLGNERPRNMTLRHIYDRGARAREHGTTHTTY